MGYAPSTRQLDICLHQPCLTQTLKYPLTLHTPAFSTNLRALCTQNARMFSMLRGFTPLKQSMPDRPAPYDKAVQVIVVFGRTGMGVSSLVNLILGREEAPYHSDIHPCTLEPTPYQTEIDGQEFEVYDFPGFRKGFSPAKLIGRLHRERGIDLVINCIRPKDGTVKGYYNAVRSAVPDRVPIVAVVTGLERHGDDMEKWWLRNGGDLLEKGLKFVDHACVTTLSPEDVSYNLDLYGRRIESTKAVRDLIIRCCN
ncbi:hypothetical protein EDD16DRAFT_1028754 [Pisolithus croceorrhizus]|nr:hypothetical protein EDD16DRAFT_1028754 [Pisolithus croceorrhizus]